MVALDLITIKFLQGYSTKPMQAFGPVGLTTSLIGLIINMYLVFEWFKGHPIGTRPLLLLGSLLIIVGIQLIGMGLLGEMLVSSYHESQRKPLYVLKKDIDKKSF